MSDLAIFACFVAYFAIALCVGCFWEGLWRRHDDNTAPAFWLGLVWPVSVSIALGIGAILLMAFVVELIFRAIGWGAP